MLLSNSSCRHRCFAFTTKLSLQFYGISHANYAFIFLVSYILNMVFTIYFYELELCVYERERGIGLFPDDLSPEEQPETSAMTRQGRKQDSAGLREQVFTVPSGV